MKSFIFTLGAIVAASYAVAAVSKLVPAASPANIAAKLPTLVGGA